MVTYLFLFSLLIGSSNAVYFRVEHADEESCELARESTTIKRYGQTGEEISPWAVLALCSGNTELPLSIGIGSIPVDNTLPPDGGGS